MEDISIGNLQMHHKMLQYVWQKQAMNKEVYSVEFWNKFKDLYKGSLSSVDKYNAKELRSCFLTSILKNINNYSDTFTTDAMRNYFSKRYYENIETILADNERYISKTLDEVKLE